MSCPWGLAGSQCKQDPAPGNVKILGREGVCGVLCTEGPEVPEDMGQVTQPPGLYYHDPIAGEAA